MGGGGLIIDPIPVCQDVSTTIRSTQPSVLGTSHAMKGVSSNRDPPSADAAKHCVINVATANVLTLETSAPGE
eukprot:11469731-Alexandrium_andersonii.AAC.1